MNVLLAFLTVIVAAYAASAITLTPPILVMALLGVRLNRHILVHVVSWGAAAIVLLEWLTRLAG